jgi:uncharacterized DUF497 family protein
MEFEWDPAKAQHNQQKHGVSFEEAVAIWDGIHVNVQDIARSNDGERRSATMGWIGNKVYMAIWTKRGGRIRLISVRRARPHEEEIFEKIQNRD